MKSPVDVEIGRTYLVPSVWSRFYSRWIPILSPAHEDGPQDCLNPTPLHWHIDWRFIERFDLSIDALYGYNEDVELRPLKCRQEVTTAVRPWLFMIEELTRRYAHYKLRERTCPHKGVQIVNSCGTCPAHGLVWDLESKQLKFKPPFYFVTPLGDKGEVRNGYCEIPITKLTPKGEHRLRAVNGEGHVYPRADYTIHMSDTLNVGDTIKIRDKHCRPTLKAKT